MNEWLESLFEHEYCPECGGDADDHTQIEVMGNPFARCNHPIPDDLTDEQIEAELAERHRRQESGLPLTPA